MPSGFEKISIKHGKKNECFSHGPTILQGLCYIFLLLYLRQMNKM